jgi:TDG/mug DNA glycosylase family protein
MSRRGQSGSAASAPRGRSPREGLAPIDPSGARVLVLGSFPSVRSLEKGEYYGHERNHFWEILGLVFGAAPPADYAGRLAFLAGRGIAVWDAIASCEREGSLDKDIRAELPNPVRDLVASRPAMSRIALNGSKSAQSFLRLIAPELGRMIPPIGEALEWRPRGLAPGEGDGRLVLVARLPSTSPVPSRDYRSAADKAGVWREFLLG